MNNPPNPNPNPNPNAYIAMRRINNNQGQRRTTQILTLEEEQAMLDNLPPAERDRRVAFINET